jgi:uncharacterized protein (UPF0333 family)
VCSHFADQDPERQLVINSGSKMAITAALEFIPYILIIILVAIIAMYYFSFEKIKSMHEDAISAMRNAVEQVTSKLNFGCKSNII